MLRSSSKFIRSFSQNQNKQGPKIPKYLSDTYWWAYIHPNAVWFFERQWLVNSILWGNFYSLRNSALSELKFPSKTLQVACVYGNFTEQISKRMTDDSQLSVVDVAEIQLKNLKKKLPDMKNITLHHQDSSKLLFENESFDNVVLFFLLHQMPEDVRQATIKESIRVLKTGGKCVIVDYHNPQKLSFFRYIMIPVLKFLEPFALDLWRKEIATWLPQVSSVKKDTYFKGLYQKVIVIK